LAHSLLENFRMRTAVQFRAHLASGAEILARPAGFLPVAPPRSGAEHAMFLPEMQHRAEFLPAMKFYSHQFSSPRPASPTEAGD
jgi:hypothetical protein